ncbi:MAG: hypothetical protein Q8L86_04565 [Vicinamibacterales bacterium]|nr:hypothetical protein [Vicinamibacterales bacterium]
MPARSCLVEVARAFTPRFEVVGALVLLDVRGLSCIFGAPQSLGRHLSAAACAAVPEAHVAVAATQTTASMMALGRPGLSVVPAGEEAAWLAALPLEVLAAYERLRLDTANGEPRTAISGRLSAIGDQLSATGEPRTALSSQLSALGEERTANGEWRRANGEWRIANSERRIANREERTASTGWRHPRDTHQAQQTRAPRRTGPGGRARAADQAVVEDALAVLDRWGLRTLGQLAALPADDLVARLGPRGSRWARLARGEDARPLVPWVDEPPYEATLELEWPIDGLEPLSFVLGRLLDPLAARLEREQRGAAVLSVRLGLVSRTAHTRVLQLPAPMRESKALRTLLLLDLESHPPEAAIDRVTVALEPAPGRVVQDSLFVRAAPPPEQVATLVARLTAIMGAGHVGTPALVDTWRPEAFEVRAFTVASGPGAAVPAEGPRSDAPTWPWAPGQGTSALRRFRLPVPIRVRVAEGRPVRVMSDRHGVAGGAIVQAAGPWRASGDWHAEPYDRDEWDVALADGTVYRIHVERTVGQWFIAGVID